MYPVYLRGEAYLGTGKVGAGYGALAAAEFDTKLCKASQRDCRPKNFLGRNATRGCPPGTPRSSALGLVVCTNSPIRAARADDAAKLSDFFLFVFRDWGLESCAKRLRC